MSSPSSARVNASSSRIRSSRREVNPSGPGASRSRAAFGASAAISNSSRVVAGTGGGGAGGKGGARVYLDGVDVTPQSLLLSRIKPSTAPGQGGAGGNKGKHGAGRHAGRARGAGGNSVMGASVILSQEHLSTSSLDDPGDGDGGGSAPTSSKTKSAQPRAPVPSTASGPSTTTAAAAASPEDDDEQDGETASTAAPTAAPKLLGDLPSSGSASGVATTSTTTAAAADPKAQARATRRPITIELGETPTIVLFELRSLCVAQDAAYHAAVGNRNKQYVELCAGKKGSDKYVEGRSQTLQLAQKTKEVMTAPPATRDSACLATDWDIFDCNRALEDDGSGEHDDGSGAMDASSSSTGAGGSGIGGGGNKAGAKAPSGGSGASGNETNELGEAVLKTQVTEIVDATMASPGCVLDVDGDIVEDLKARQQAHRHARKHKHGANSTSNSQKSRVFHHGAGSANQSTQDAVGRSTLNVHGNSSSSMASPSQSTGSVSFGASQDVVNATSTASSGPEDGSSNSVVATSQVGVGGASQVFSGPDSHEGKGTAYARANTNVDLGLIIAQQRTGKVLSSASLLKTVNVVERAVQQNVYHPQHVLYRNFPALTPTVGGPEGTRKDPHADGDWRSSLGMMATGEGFAGVSSTSSSTAAASNGSSSLVPPIASLGAIIGGGPKHRTLEKLWAFQCGLTQGRTVTCLAWNTVNEDLLAVSYAWTAPATTSNGVTTSTTTTGGTLEDGLVLFWSLKNPEFPERIYNLSAGVTSIDFSRSHPYLLAVGFVNGVIAIYDTRKDDVLAPPPATTASAKPPPTGGAPPATGAAATVGDAPPSRHVPVAIATSETSSGKHLDAVWQVKWISKGSDRGENVVSISSDGRVTEWSMKKGLSFSDLMTLKRVANPLLGSDSRADGVISRQASGHCIDFARHDPSVYYVGTEDGIIHKCSVSYNEQYLQTYYGHTGPVYQLLVSPFSPDLFLSCSADWNVKLWHQGEQTEALNFRSVNLQHAVLGITWCPNDATIFGAVTEDGRIEIWDLEHSSLDPIITHYPTKYAPAASTDPATATTTPGATATGGGASGLDVFDDLAGGVSMPHNESSNALGADGNSLPTEIPLECTKIAFAPSAPVIVVGDSTGDVTVYRVPVLADGRASEAASSSTAATSAGGNSSHDDQVARLHRALNPNQHE